MRCSALWNTREEDLKAMCALFVPARMRAIPDNLPMNTGQGVRAVMHSLLRPCLSHGKHQQMLQGSEPPRISYPSHDTSGNFPGGLETRVHIMRTRA